ncbi:MAG: hypothetical protein ACP5R5_02970, partial [Armatimonadota bacterium]
NLSAQHVPGIYEPDREVLRDATYYYWCWSVAHALGELPDSRIPESTAPSNYGPPRWAEELAQELIKRQNADGAWRNPFTDAKEDDPLIATPWAAAALAICREVITGQINELVPRRSARSTQ